MKRADIVTAVGVLLGILCIGSTVAGAAELYGTYRTVEPHRKAGIVATDCGWRCRAPCPGGYSCAPLYGGFIMPYGSPAYWGRYTAGGWTP